MDIMEMGVAGTAVLQEQIMQLANYIMANVEGEPSQSQGAVDTAIRIMDEQAARIAELKAELAQRTADTNAMVGNCEAKIAELEEHLAAANAEIERLTGELSPLGLPAPYIVREADHD